MGNFNEFENNEAAFYIKTKNVQDPQLEKEMEKELLSFFKSIMKQKEANRHLVFYDDDSTLIIFSSKSKINQVINFLESKNVLDTYREISMDILMDREKGDEFEKAFSEVDKFKSILDNFISENLTIDLVLDKINERGIDSLKKIDYAVLKSLGNK